ncbi:MAG: hypothetical protein JXR37_10420 [Kiritimatiellae bacterium]|nr:hypothetical protein [Kiritimatiellia bacterium]
MSPDDKLAFDLELLPDFAKEGYEPSRRAAGRLTDDDRRPPRDGRHGGRRRDDRERRGAPRRREGRDEYRQRDDRDRRSRPPRREGETPDSRDGYAPARARARAAPDTRGEPRGPAAEQRPVPVQETAPVEVSFVPQPQFAQNLAKQIQNLGLAFPLFGIAEMFLKEHASYLVHLKGKADVTLWQVRPSGEVFLSEQEAVDFALRNCLDRFYEEVRVPCEAPKGAWQSVVRCRLDGSLVAPVNHHSYHSEVMKLWHEKFGHMELAAFRDTLENVADEELVKAWLEKVSFVVVWRPKSDDGAQRPHQPAPAEADAQAAPAEADPQAVSAETDPQAAPVEADTQAAPTEADPQAASAEADPQAAPAEADTQAAPTEADTQAAPTEADPQAAPAETDAQASPAEADTQAAPAEADPQAAPAEADTQAAPAEADTQAAPAQGAEDPSAAAAACDLRTEADVQRDFRERYKAKIIKAVREARAPGAALRRAGTPLLRSAVAAAWREELKFPLNMANSLREVFRRTSLKMFKSRRNVTFVGVVLPKPLAAGVATPTIAAILRCIEERGPCTRKQLVEGLNGARAAAGAAAEETAATPQKTAAESQAPDGGAEPDATPAGVQPAVAPETFAADLALLIREGYVVELSSRKLVLAKEFVGGRKKRKKTRKKAAEPQKAKPSAEG